ncbi:hypothetical protein QYS48_14170 [Marivirga arenosa]|jgi:hypothetical protein|uniref:Uncharacterized protein n=1 Tax=Marivirga arenosa TaxID=3059076 RepID=A0AA49GE62_9BACT|nr:hypothetical protein [Marivirga sp. ABR2-2]WKK83477.1 hypothetical protein QYS48_14170 [Marivirga sp. ABR2-2]
MKSSAVVHEYYKRVFDDYTVLVQVNPINFTGLELIIHPEGKIEKTKMEFDEHIKEDLEHDDFQSTTALEFNLYLKGLVK